MNDVTKVQKPSYESPEIVKVGSVVQLTNGMGGSSKDMDGWTIPVVPKDDDCGPKDRVDLV